MTYISNQLYPPICALFSPLYSSVAEVLYNDVHSVLDNTLRTTLIPGALIAGKEITTISGLRRLLIQRVESVFLPALQSST